MQEEREPGDPLSAVFEDLEQQAAALHLEDRDAELADRVHGEYAEVTLGARLHASLGHSVRLELPGTGVAGLLEQVGEGWCRVRTAPAGAGAGAGAARTWVVRVAAIVAVSGLSPRAVPDVALPAVARLGLRAAVRGLAEGGEPVVVRLLDGTERQLRLRRVGADFLEGEGPGPERALETLLVPFDSVVGLHRA